MSNPKKQDSYIHYDHESRIVRLETVIENINKTMTRIENKIDKLDSRIWSNFYWVMGAIGGLFLMMAHGFHWI